MRSSAWEVPDLMETGVCGACVSVHVHVMGNFECVSVVILRFTRPICMPLYTCKHHRYVPPGVNFAPFSKFKRADGGAGGGSEGVPVHSNTACHQCHKEGHWAKDCPDTTCHKCWEKGHEKRNCPNSKRARR